jgi:hypothetical protein
VQPVILNNGNPAQGTRNCGHGPIARRVLCASVVFVCIFTVRNINSKR